MKYLRCGGSGFSRLPPCCKRLFISVKTVQSAPSLRRKILQPKLMLKLLYTDCHMMLLHFLIMNDVIPA